MVINNYIPTLAILNFFDNFIETDYIWAIAGIFSFFGTAFSLYNITRHLSNWNQPIFQLWIILFIIPIYSSISFISLHFKKESLYIEIIRDCYESFVIYCFLIWILNIIGGKDKCQLSIAYKMYMKHPPPLCCLPSLRLNSNFLRICKQMTLQFVILKPVLTVISFTLLFIDVTQNDSRLYYNKYWQIILLSIYNISYTLALYGLLLFYMATKKILDGHSPVKKFFAVKSIVFMTYWQSLFMEIFFGEQYDKYNDFLLCIEMTLFSIIHYRVLFGFGFCVFLCTFCLVFVFVYQAFPWTEFRWLDKKNVQTLDNNYKNIQITSVYEIKNEEKVDGNKLTEEEIKTDESNVGMIDGSNVNVNVNDSIRSWFLALFTVINVMDVCNDAYHNFVPLSVIEERMKKNEENEIKKDYKNISLLDDEIKLDSCRDGRQEYIQDLNKIGVELVVNKQAMELSET